MKSFALLFAVATLLAGCATQKQVATMEGRGKQQVFRGTYDQVWRAAVDAAQIADLRVRNADKDIGYIAAHRGIQPHTFGENVGIWVKPATPTETRVEVVSRQAGPPKFWFKNWQDEILESIAANMTRESTGLIREPTGAEIYPDHY